MSPTDPRRDTIAQALARLEGWHDDEMGERAMRPYFRMADAVLAALADMRSVPSGTRPLLEQVGWRNTDTGEVVATWMTAKPAGPWVPVYIVREDTDE